jgi:hypothetical protein
MKIINCAYAVLSDPARRREHDEWVAREEGAAKHSAYGTQQSPSRQPDSPQQPRVSNGSARSQAGLILLTRLTHLLRFWQLYLVVGILIWAWIEDAAGPPKGPKPYQATPPIQLTPPAPEHPVYPVYMRPPFAPNGQPWPTTAAYIAGEPRLYIDGYSKVTIDNTQNNSDVFVKLVAIDGATAYPVRQFFIAANLKFTVNKVRAGTYDVRYRDLDTGELVRSESFALTEVKEASGISFSDFTLTLYKVQNGNFHSYDLAENEF